MQTKEDLLAVVADHADRIAEGDQLVDQDSMKVAEAIAALKETDWVEEYETYKPAKPDALGVIKSDSDRRFAEWVAWQEEKRNRRSLTTRRIGQLATANKIAAHVNGVHAATEWVIRPLAWMLGTPHEARMTEVWATAKDLADNEGVEINQSHVRHAVAEFKKTLPKGAVQKVKAEKKAARFLRQAQDYVRQLWGTGAEDDQRAFDDWYKRFRKGENV